MNGLQRWGMCIRYPQRHIDQYWVQFVIGRRKERRAMMQITEVWRIANKEIEAVKNLQPPLPRPQPKREAKQNTDKMAEVGYAEGVTLNIGNYESVRIDVRLNMPCAAESTEQVFESVKEQVKRWLSQEVNAVRQ